MADAVLVLKIVTDAAQAQKGLAATGSRVGKMQAGLGKLVAPAAGAALAIAAFGKASVDAASRAQQAVGAVDSVFGKNAGKVKNWAKSSATDLGLARSEYMEAASVIGAQLKNMGVPMDRVAGQTNELVKLGADLSATYGGTTKEAVEALGSALRGETDPIERYGVSIKQADIAAQQAKDGTDKLTGAAGKQAKTMALLKLVNKQTADAQGQFARESDSAAGSAQIAAAQFEDMQATLGQALLPVVSSVTSILGKLFTLMAKHQTTTKAVIAVIAAMAAAILILNVALSVYTAVTTLAGSATLAAWIAAAWPILAVVAAVLLVVGAVVLLWKKSKTFRTIVLATWAAIKTAAIAVARATKAAWNAVWNALKVSARAMGNAVKAVWNGIRSVARTVGNAVKAAWNAVWSAIKTGVRAAIAVVKTVIQGVRTTVSNVVAGVKTLFSGMWSAVKSGAKGVGAVLSAPFNAMESAVKSVIGWVESLISKISNIKMPKLSFPKIPGLSRVAPSGVPMARAVGGYASPTGPGVGAPRATAGGAPVVIQITGALDPEAVARQVRRILGAHDVRVGVAAR